MPVEIRELVIKATVADTAPAVTTTSSTPSTTTNNGAIISACVEQVLEILKEKNER